MAVRLVDSPELEVMLWDLGAAFALLVLGASFTTLRVALQHSHPARVLARAQSEARKKLLEPLLDRTDTLATSASIVEVTFELAFVAYVMKVIAGESGLGLRSILSTLAVSVPTILIFSEALPTALALRRGDGILLRFLPTFHVAQLPLSWLVRALESTRRALMRIVGLNRNPASARQIVEGLREVIEDSEISGDLDETEREIIGNVMEVRDVQVAAVMTPRTEVSGVDLSEGLSVAARRTAESGHSRLPVYEGSLDKIVGIITARDIVQVAAEQGLEHASLRSILRPAHFVPETKRVSALLSEFRREKIKLAVVLDEYGGTAGLVTLGDIITEIVGDIPDEFDQDSPQAVRRLADGGAEVDASMHVSSVNEELHLEIPEGEDYETLAGFVLAKLGHFPKRGERFVADGIEYSVIDASDRRVHKVAIRRARHGAVAPG